MIEPQTLPALHPVPLIYKITASIFWLAFCFSAHWGEIVVPLFFGIGFGTIIWIYGWKLLPGETLRFNLIFSGVLCVIFVGTIIGFQLYEHPFISAALIINLFLTFMRGRYVANIDSRSGNGLPTKSDDQIT